MKAQALLIAAFIAAGAAAEARRPDCIVRTGKHLEDVAMPLGAVGGGHVSICGDGAVRQWNIFNNANPGFTLPHSFFAIRAARSGGTPVAKRLQQTPVDGTPVDGLPPVDAVEFVGEYPIAELKFLDRELPVDVSLTAFSPHIPLNAADSSIPAVVFEFTVRNRTSSDVSVSLLSTLQNAVGTNGQKPTSGVLSKYYGGNENRVLRGAGFSGALLANPKLGPDARHPGSMAVAVLGRGAEVTPQWDNLPLLWNEFARSGRVDGAGTKGPSPDGRTWNAAVTAPFVLKPGCSRTVAFVWAWHFPRRYVFWDGRAQNADVGTMYAGRFSDAAEVVRYVASNYARLAGETRKFRDTFYKTSLPYYVLDRISAQSSTLVSTVCMWLADGTFAAFEGGPACCPLNCTHVWNYEQQMAYLFPELDRAMRKTDFEVQQTEDGGIRHRTRLPLAEPREHMVFCDGQLGTVLKAYREHRQSADGRWLKKYWPNIKKAMEYAAAAYDPNNDGVIVGSQWNTYDATMYGPNTFIGALYLAALRACEEMAGAVGDADYAGRMRRIFESGTSRLDAVLWTDEYYRHIESKPAESEVGQNRWLLEDWPETRPNDRDNRPYGRGCHIDQFLGQWWANQLGLGYVLPAGNVRTALGSILKYNWVPDFGRVTQVPRAFAGEGDPGVYNCTWPNGGQPPNEMLYSFEVWTGLEYELAALLIQEGRVEDAYRIVKAVSDRYNGRERHPIRRNPFAEVECGDHYARAMSSWGIILAAQGYSYCGPEKRIGFEPKVTSDNHRSFFTGSEGWGLFSQRRKPGSQVNELAVEYGTLDVNEITLALPEEAAAAASSGRLAVRVDKRFGALEVSRPAGQRVTVSFRDTVRLKAGQRLSISFAW